MRVPPPLREGIRPIFIIGAPRSGTSIMTWAIGQHPNIQTMEETNWIAGSAIGAYLSHALGSSRGPHTQLSDLRYSLEAYLRRLGDFVDAVVRDCFDVRSRRFYGDSLQQDQLRLTAAFNPELPLLRSPSDPKLRWVDGTPLNTHFTWALAQMFPKALFIHNLRRPEDVATSLEGFDTVGAASVPLAGGLAIWLQHTEAAALAERAFGSERVFRLRFERIGSDPEKMFRDLLGFLGEEYCPDCVSTLSQRLNSSEVSGRRKSNADAMLEMPEFLRASSLYWQLQSNRPPPPEAVRVADMDQLRERFEVFCNGRSLL